MDTPVAFMVFRRPALTARVFAEIRAVRPTTLFIIADGPRDGVPADVENCVAVREVVADVDWPCEIHRLYSDTNLGCGRRVASGLDAVFDEVEECIILEDDCLPDPTFFTYCAELLERYRTDARIMSISGSNFQHGQSRGAGSYYYSIFAHCWGWASWRRAWRQYDASMSQWPRFRDSGRLSDLLPHRVDVEYWCWVMEAVRSGQIDTWDYQWMFACWLHGGLTCLPQVNLVQNLGFGEDATHTKRANNNPAGSRAPLALPLIHPERIVRNELDVVHTMRHRYEVSPHTPVRGKLHRLRQMCGRWWQRLVSQGRAVDD